MADNAVRRSADERWARQWLIPGWRQDLLAESRVVVVGMGALGNEVSRILAMAGIGSLLLCDPDTVEVSNLSRTVLLREADVGKLKVEAAAPALRSLAPGIEVVTRALPLVSGVGLAELRDASLVLGCLDSRSARLELAGRANLVGAPLIDGGTQFWGGEVHLKLEAESPCYGCGLSWEERAISDEPWSCLDEPDGQPTGSAVTTTAVVGAWMADCAVRYLMGFPLEDGILAIDGGRGAVRRTTLERDPTCPLHEPVGEVERLKVTSEGTIAELRAELGEGASPLAWRSFQTSADCPSCGFESDHQGVVNDRSACPECGSLLVPRTTLELDAASDSVTLGDLGVAPGEILALRETEELRWVELAWTDGGRSVDEEE